MTTTKFVLAIGSKEHPIDMDATFFLPENIRARSAEQSLQYSSRLEDLCKRTVKEINLAILSQQSSIQDIEARIELNNDTQEHIKEMFWGKNWRDYINKLENRKKQYEKIISSYNHIIDIISDNMYTDDFSVACDLVELYFKFVENIKEEGMHKVIVGDTAFYKFSHSTRNLNPLPYFADKDLNLHANPNPEDLSEQHAVLQRFNPEILK